jgi:hypothetical protein
MIAAISLKKPSYLLGRGLYAALEANAERLKDAGAAGRGGGEERRGVRAYTGKRVLDEERPTVAAVAGEFAGQNKKPSFSRGLFSAVVYRRNR